MCLGKKKERKGWRYRKSAKREETVFFFSLVPPTFVFFFPPVSSLHFPIRAETRKSFFQIDRRNKKGNRILSSFLSLERKYCHLSSFSNFAFTLRETSEIWAGGGGGGGGGILYAQASILFPLFARGSSILSRKKRRKGRKKTFSLLPPIVFAFDAAEKKNAITEELAGWSAALDGHG